MTKPMTPRERERWSKELLKHTPLSTEGYHDKREREAVHRALPNEQQPYMVCYFGMLDYGVLWIGKEGGTEEQAEREAEWWREQIREGLEISGFSRKPDVHMVMVRQQWDLDDLTHAILSSY